MLAIERGEDAANAPRFILPRIVPGQWGGTMSRPREDRERGRADDRLGRLVTLPAIVRSRQLDL
jgi:hypothetical protein